VRAAISAFVLAAGACLIPPGALALEDPAQHVAGLVVTLKSANPAERAAAARILGEMGPAAKDGVPDLIVVVLGDADGAVRRSAARSLGDIGPAARAAGPALVKTLQDRDWQVRQAAAYALGRVGSPEARPALEAAKKDTNENVKRAAKTALKALKKKS
jgi:HEAT repeat protein